jgi:hypothetical protein
MANSKVCLAQTLQVFFDSMNTFIEVGAIKKFKRTSWRFQETFQTPLKDLDRFVSTILLRQEKVEQAHVIIDQIVFEPKNLNALISNNETKSLSKDWSLLATHKEEVQILLRAALADWVDFAFIPSPKPFVIYGDHDEYTTFYANTKSNLNSVVSVLIESGFKQVTNWQRHF